MHLQVKIQGKGYYRLYVINDYYEISLSDYNYVTTIRCITKF